MVPNYIIASLFAAITVGLAVYMADNSSSKIAGIIAAFPTALISLLFIQEYQTLTDTSKYFAYGMIGYLIATIILYMYLSRYKGNKYLGMAIAVGLWAMITYILMSIIK